MFNPDKIADFPTLPGVYIMKRLKGGEVLYVGKAKNLKARVRQYFVKGGDGREIIPYLVAQVDEIETIVVTSEKEALLVENNLIKKYKPRYNALLKDDKSYIALKVTIKHIWPRVEVVRLKEKAKRDGLYFGPYTSAHAARQTLEILQRIFPLRQCSDQELLRRTRPCILYDMKRCIAPCVGKCTKEEYDQFVDSTINFLKGKRKEVLSLLYVELEKASEKLEFEKAQAIWTSIQQIEQTLEAQKVQNPMGGDFDALGIYRQGDEVILSELVVRDGKLIAAHPHNFDRIIEDDSELYTSFIMQHYEGKEDKPYEILVPIDIPEAETLSEITGIALHKPQRGEKRKYLDLAYLNAETSFKKVKDEALLREKALLELQEKLSLTRYPKVIECIDNSNLSGSEAVSALIAFEDGLKAPSRYRKFKIREADVSDDYGMMREVLFRRYRKAKEENHLPDLLIIDGGKGHLNMAIKVMEELDIASVDLIGVAKDEGRHDKGVTQEQVFLRNVKDPVLLRSNSPALFLLQKIRDEAHRSAITFQKKRRSKALIKSLLDNIKGIGPVKRKKLLIHFGSVEKVSEATREELEAVVTKKDAEIIIQYFLNGY